MAETRQYCTSSPSFAMVVCQSLIDLIDLTELFLRVGYFSSAFENAGSGVHRLSKELTEAEMHT